MDPEILTTGREGKAQSIAGRFEVAFLPEVDPLFIVEPSFLDSSGVDDFKIVPVSADSRYTDRTAARATSSRLGASSTPAHAAPTTL
jgi:hypothetical protein